MYRDPLAGPITTGAKSWSDSVIEGLVVRYYLVQDIIESVVFTGRNPSQAEWSVLIHKLVILLFVINLTFNHYS